MRGDAALLEKNAAGLDVDISAVSLQKIFVYLTGGHKEGE